VRWRPSGATGAREARVRSWLVTALAVLLALVLLAAFLLVGAVTTAVVGLTLLVLWRMFRRIGPLE
jgi:hypothetical protein